MGSINRIESTIDQTFAKNTRTCTACLQPSAPLAAGQGGHLLEEVARHASSFTNLASSCFAVLRFFKRMLGNLQMFN